MSKSTVLNSVTRSFHKVGFQLKKHSPEILVVAGVIGTVASTVMACKATLKVNEVLNETKETVDMIHESVEKYPDTVYSEEDCRKDLSITYKKTGVKVAALYAPSVLLGAASITSILVGYNILHKRNVAVIAAYTAAAKEFKQYRSRVVERFGKELDRELRYGIRTKEVEERVVDEDGNETIVPKTVTTVADDYSEFAKCFDETCVAYEKCAEDNMRFLKAQQNYANDLLKRRGHVFLNEVYDMLGFDRTKAGAVVGWIYNEAAPNGDNFIDFGIFNINSKAARDFVNGRENAIWLDFNVDGVIYDKL